MAQWFQACVIYTRVSTAGQEEDGTSLTMQEERCRAYAQEQGWRVIEVFSDTYSGGYLYERKGLSAMRDLVRTGAVNVILSYAIDRLSRSQSHLAIIMDDAARHGCGVDFVTEKFEDTPVGRFILSAKSFAAEIEREKIGERSTRGMRGRSTMGKLMPGCRPPYGYRWVDAPEAASDPEKGAYRKVALELDPEREPIVRRIFDEILSGGTLRGVADSLTRSGIPTVTGRSPHWNASTITDLVNHPVYCGRPVALRNVRTKNKYGRPGKKLRAADEAVPLPEGVAPAIVTLEEWTAVQDQLAMNKAQSRRRLSVEEAQEYLLRSGFARCGHCGSTLGVNRYKGRAHTYYCNRKAASAFFDCPGVSILAKPLDRDVWEYVSGVLTRPDIIARELKKLERRDATKADLSSIERSLAENARKRSNLIASLADLDDEDTRNEIKKAMATLAEQRRELEATRDEIAGRQDAWVRAQEQLGGIQAWCRSVAKRVESLSYDDRRLALTALGVKVRVYRSGGDKRWEIEARIGMDIDLTNGTGLPSARS